MMFWLAIIGLNILVAALVTSLDKQARHRPAGKDTYQADSLSDNLDQVVEGPIIMDDDRVLDADLAAASVAAANEGLDHDLSVAEDVDQFTSYLDQALAQTFAGDQRTDVQIQKPASSKYRADSNMKLRQAMLHYEILGPPLAKQARTRPIRGEK